jgi:hypothetical protein
MVWVRYEELEYFIQLGLMATRCLVCTYVSLYVRGGQYGSSKQVQPSNLRVAVLFYGQNFLLV